MFEIEDMLKIISALFIIFPLVSFIHESGHLIFAYLFGAKDLKITIGSGKPVFRCKFLEFRKYYFWYSWCYYSDLERNNRLTNVLVYSGPMLMNLTAAFLVNWLTLKGILDSSLLAYQFVYFSIYFVIFDLIPITYHDGQPSNGRVIYELIRYGNKISYKKGDFKEEAKRMREKNQTTEDRGNV